METDRNLTSKGLSQMRTYALSLAGVSAIAASAAAMPQTSPPPPVTDASSEVDQLKSIVKDLQGQVDALRAENDEQWLTEARANEIRGLVQDVLADADTRASLLQTGSMAGYDKGFFVSSADGNYLLRIGGQLQVRYVYNLQDSDGATDDNRSGFEVRRAKLIMRGHVFDPSWTYDVQFAADRATGNVQLEDAGWLQKDLGNGLKFRFGQMKAPFLREEILSSTRMMAIERSLVNSFFTAGTVQGATATYEADRWRISGMVHDGNNSRNTSWSTEDTEFAFSARGEWLAMGEAFKDLEMYDGFRGGATGLVIGGAMNYSKGEFGTGSNLPPPDFNNNEVDNIGLTADATWLANGWSVAGAVMWRTLDPQTGDSLDQLGLLIRGGYFLTDDWELYGQYEWADSDIDGVEDLSVITVGVTKYWDKHNLKWQADIGYGLNEVASVFAQDGAGWRADPTGDDGQIVFRTQIQLLF